MGLRGTKRKEKYQGVPGGGEGELLLAVDTSSELLSVVLQRGDLLLGRFEVLQAHTHGRYVLSAIEAVMEASRLKLTDVDVFGMCVGPGSFTGLRVGMAAVKGICAGVGGKPAVGVSSVEVLAAQSEWREGLVVPAIDAKRGEVYYAVYEKGPEGVIRRMEPFAATPDEGLQRLLAWTDQPLHLIGSACVAYGPQMVEQGQGRVELASDSMHGISAAALGRCCMARIRAGETVAAGVLEPQYAREPNIG